jgi:hypothetical protein
LRPAAGRRHATTTRSSARSSTARRRQLRRRLPRVWCGGEPGGSRRQARSSRATCDKAWSTTRVARPTLGGPPPKAGGWHRSSPPSGPACLPHHLRDRRRVAAPVLGRPCHPRRPWVGIDEQRPGPPRCSPETYSRSRARFQAGSEAAKTTTSCSNTVPYVTTEGQAVS